MLKKCNNYRLREEKLQLILSFMFGGKFSTLNDVKSMSCSVKSYQAPDGLIEKAKKEKLFTTLFSQSLTAAAVINFPDAEIVK